MGDSQPDRLLGVEDWPDQAAQDQRATQEPMVTWLRHRRQSKRQMENPSWLLSLITHMSVLIVIGALASAPRAGGHSSPLVITMSLADGDDEENSSPIATTVVQSQPHKSDGTLGDQANSDTVARGDSAKAAKAAAPESPQRNPSEELRRVTVKKPVVRWGQTPVNLQRLASSLSTKTPPTHWSTFSTQGSLPNRHDDIVDRFIEYDVGRLRGAAGVRALRDFQQLGPEAIPALVRGLNRAAAMRASCPIGVISSRLNTILRQTNDSRMVRYALENIGRDVDTNAPHYRSIQSLLYRLKKAFGSLTAGSSKHVAKRRLKWWMPDERQFDSRDAQRMNQQEGRHEEPRSRPQPPLNAPGQREYSDTWPGARTLKPLPAAPLTMKDQWDREFEGARGNRRRRADVPPPRN